MFKKIIEEILNKYTNKIYEKKEIKVINLIIYTICQRLLFVMVRLTNHCNRTIIKELYLDLAMQLELNNIDYDLRGINVNNEITHFIRNIYYQNVSSVFELSKSTVNLMAKLIVFLIKYFIQNGKNTENILDYKLVLSSLEKNNQALYNFILKKYNFK